RARVPRVRRRDPLTGSENARGRVTAKDPSTTRRSTLMGLGTSIFLIAVGAILDFAVNWRVQGVDLHTVGAILMIVGAIGLLLSLIFWNSWGGFSRRDSYADGGPRRRVV